MITQPKKNAETVQLPQDKNLANNVAREQIASVIKESFNVAIERVGYMLLLHSLDDNIQERDNAVFVMKEFINYKKGRPKASLDQNTLRDLILNVKPELAKKFIETKEAQPMQNLQKLTLKDVNGNPVEGRTKNQKALIDTILANQLVLALGPAGTGKTYLAIAAAVDALTSTKPKQNPNTKNKNAKKQADQDAGIKKIIVARPAVEASETLGYLKGPLHEKLAPYMRPVFSSLKKLIKQDQLKVFMDKETIEVCSIGHMRGDTFEDTFVLIDEAQNTTEEEMDMIITRLGNGSKLVLAGDLNQVDLKLKDGAISGLQLASEVFALMQENGTSVGIATMDNEDIQRSPLVRSWLEAKKQRKEMLESQADTKTLANNFASNGSSIGMPSDEELIKAGFVLENNSYATPQEAMHKPGKSWVHQNAYNAV